MQQKKQVKKTPDQIMKANLAKTLRGLKTKVANKEELWLEFFQEGVWNLLSSEQGEILALNEVVDKGRVLANLMLDVYEERWGK
jgi:hypothetical protein